MFDINSNLSNLQNILNDKCINLKIIHIMQIGGAKPNVLLIFFANEICTENLYDKQI